MRAKTRGGLRAGKIREIVRYVTFETVKIRTKPSYQKRTGGERAGFVIFSAGLKIKISE